MHNEGPNSKLIFQDLGLFYPSMLWNLESACLKCHFIFLDLSFWLLRAWIRFPWFCLRVFAFRCCFCAKDNNSPFRTWIEDQISIDTMSLDPRTKLIKVGTFWLLVNLEDSNIEKHEFGCVENVLFFLLCTPFILLM